MSDLIRFATPRRQSRASLHGGWLDGGSLEIYDGAMPADSDTAPTTQVLLVTLQLDNPAGSATDGVWTADPIAAAMILEGGTAAWARAKDSGGSTVADYSVGATSSGEAIELDNVVLVAGAMVAVTSWTITEG